MDRAMISNEAHGREDAAESQAQPDNVSVVMVMIMRSVVRPVAGLWIAIIATISASHDTETND